MYVLIRTLLIWLLALAIPAQGVAATTMAFCGSNHHGSAAAATAGNAASAGHGHHGHEAAVAHEHPQAQASTPVAHDPGLAAQAKVGSGDSHKCNVCGSCCSTGALVSAMPTLPAADAASTVFTSVVATVDPFAADGPDRPPRNLPA